MKLTPIIGATLIALFSNVGLAQEKVLKGSEISESSLVNALTPPAPAAAEGTAADEGGEQPKRRMRSIKVVREDGSAPSASAAPRPVAKAKPPSASMLITFMTNSAELTPDAKQILDKVGRALKSDQLSSFNFSIEGHADPRGGEDFNLRLSQARAESVAEYLSKTHSIDRSRLVPVGKGDSELMDKANLQAPENRRVTIKTMVN